MIKHKTQDFWREWGREDLLLNRIIQNITMNYLLKISTL